MPRPWCRSVGLPWTHRDRAAITPGSTAHLSGMCERALSTAPGLGRHLTLHYSTPTHSFTQQLFIDCLVDTRMFKASDPVLDELTVDRGTWDRCANIYNPGQCEISMQINPTKLTVPGTWRMVTVLVMTKGSKLEKEQNELRHKGWVRFWQNNCWQEGEEVGKAFTQKRQCERRYRSRRSLNSTFGKGKARVQRCGRQHGRQVEIRL